MPLLSAASGDLRSAAKQLGNIIKTESKRNLLHVLSPSVAQNELVSPTPPVPKAKHISELVQPKTGAPTAATGGVPATADKTGVRLYTPEVALAQSDREMLAKVFNQGSETLIMEGSFGLMEDFTRRMADAFKKESEQYRQNNIESRLASANSDAQQPTKKPRKQGSAAALQTKRVVPTRFSGRYPAAFLALYAPGGAATVANDSKAAKNVDRGTPGTRFLQLEFNNSRVPANMYTAAIATVVNALEKRHSRVEGLKGPPPVLLRWKYVQENAYIEALNEKEECSSKTYCVGQDILHPKGGCFTFRKWQPPGSTRLHAFCYACILRFTDFMLSIEEVVDSRESSTVIIPFTYLCEVIGEYNSKAFRKCNNEQVTEKVRILSYTDLMPAPDTPDGRRRYFERPTLQYLDGSRRLSTLPPVNPLSYTTFEIEETSNERIILQWIFRDLEGRFRDVLKQELPEWIKVCRLAFLPIEQGMKLFDDIMGRNCSEQGKAFLKDYLPADFKHNSEYYFKFIDMTTVDGPRGGIARPPMEGYSIYWVQHIRVNAAMRLLEENGLAALYEMLTSGTPGPAGGAEIIEMKQKKRSAPPTREAAASPDPIGQHVTRECAGTGNMKELVRKEFAAKREQIANFIKAQSDMLNYFRAELRKPAPMIHDDALLSEDVWALIKPKEAYLGPFFPEDRRFKEVIKEPSLVYRPGAGQTILCLLRQWCVTPNEEALKPGVTIVNGVILDGKVVDWTTDKPASLSSTSGKQLLYCPNPDHEGSIMFDFELLFGDLKATLWWVAEDAESAQLDSFIKSCDYFVSTWDYGRLYHPKVNEALQQGASVWRKKYNILVSVLIRVHCATVLLKSLEEIRDDRNRRFSNWLEKLEDDKVDMFSRVAATMTKNILEYELPADVAAMVKPRQRLLALKNSTKALQEVIYQIHRFINNHLPLAHAMVVNCTDGSGEGPLDSILLDPGVLKCAMSTDDRSARPSLFEMLLPENDNVMCEDNLPDCSSREHQLKFISDSGVHEPLLTAQQKSAPVRCHMRDADKQSALMAAHNEAFLKYCSQTMYCTALGGYRTAVYRPCFAKSLELYNKFHEKITSPMDKTQNQSLITVCKYLTINAIRENTTMHIGNSAGFCLAIRVCFKKSGKNYGDFERHWLPACTDEIRKLIDQGQPLSVVNATIRDTQSRSRSFVYRRTKTDFLRQIWGLLKEVLCRRIVAAFDETLEWPDVLTMHRDSIKMIFRIVNEVDPHSKDFDYAPLLKRLHCTDSTIALIKSIENRFNTDSSSNAAVFESELEAELDEVQHLILFAFFHILRAHAAIRVLPLSKEVTEMQIEAVLKRTCSTTPDSPFPIGSCLMQVCGVIGCHTRKTPMAQNRGLRYIGNFDVSWNAVEQKPECKPKKTAKGGNSKAAREQRSQKGLAATWAVIEAEKNKAPSVVPLTGRVSSERSTRGRKKKKKGDEDSDEEDADINDDFMGYADEDTKVQDAKSIRVALRTLLDEAHTVKEMIADMVRDGELQEPITEESLHENTKTRLLIDRLHKRRLDLQKAARKEANQFVRSIFDLPCEDGVITSYCLLGNVIQRDFIKEKAQSEAYTLCPSCGVPTFFRTDMIYSNGFTCGVCDHRLREDLLRPSCIGCHRLYLTLEGEKKVKKPKGANAATASASAAVSQGTQTQASASSVMQSQMMIVSKGVMSAPPLPGTGAQKSSHSFGRGASAAAAAVAASAGSIQVSAPTGRKAGIAGGKRSKKRKQSDESKAFITRPSMSAAEDAVLRERRKKKGPNALGKVSSEEWYGYNLYDCVLGEMKISYVCGACALDRHWIRALEHTLSVQDVIRLIKCGITKKEDAARFCNIGLNVIDSEAAAEVQTQEQQKKDEDKGKRPRSDVTDKLTKRYAKAGRRAQVTVIGIPTPAVTKDKPIEATSQRAADATQAAVTKAVNSAGLGGKGKKKTGPETARSKLHKKMAEMEKRGGKQQSGALYDI